MTDGNANPLASAGESGDSTGVDGSDDWAKAVLDGLRADDARSDSPRPSGDDQAGGARADTVDSVEDGSSTLAPVADQKASSAGESKAAVEVDEVEVVDVGSSEQSGTDGDPVCAPQTDGAQSTDSSSADHQASGLEPDPGAAEGQADDVPPPPQGEPLAPGSVEDLVADLERVTGERDTYLESSRRIQAEFENYRKQVGKRETEARERANESLVSELLPVLDACDGAIANGAEDVVPIGSSLIDALTKQGLERIDPTDAPFDPEFHEAVMHEDGDSDGGPTVAEVMRAGYTWKGRVVRPAMVRVRG